MKITNDAVHGIYDLCKQVHEGRITKIELIKAAGAQKLMAEGSASNYAQNFAYMMRGIAYMRAMNLYSSEYFLRKIREDYGQYSFNLALNAVQGHVVYYNGLGRGNQVSLTMLLKKLGKEFQTGDVEGFWHPDEVDQYAAKDLREGRTKKVTVNVYERSREARNACIAEYGYSCSVCGFDFEEGYGEIGRGFIHVHHLLDLAQIDEEYIVSPKDDLRPVCPNCHAMLHKEKPAMSIEELKAILSAQS